MGKKLKEKVPQKKNTTQRNSDNRRDNWPLGGSKYLYSKSPQIEYEQAKEVSGTNFWSSSDTFPYSSNVEDIESDSEINKEEEVKRLTDKLKINKIYLTKGSVPSKKKLPY